MKSLWNWCKEHPTQAVAIVTIVLGWFSFIIPPAVLGGLATIVGIVLGVGVHSIVTPVTTAATQITEAATTAATETVKQLDQATVGVTGNITKAGTDVINNVVNQTVGNLLGGK